MTINVYGLGWRIVNCLLNQLTGTLTSKNNWLIFVLSKFVSSIYSVLQSTVISVTPQINAL